MNPLKAVFSEAGLFLLLCCIEILLPIFAVESPLNNYGILESFGNIAFLCNKVAIFSKISFFY